MKEHRIENPVGGGRGQRLLSVDETAEYLGRTRGAIYEMIYSGKLKHVRWDRRIFVDRNDLDDLIEQAKTVYRY